MVFILECADGSYYTGMCNDFRKKLWEIENGINVYFTTHPERLPVRIIFEEKGIPFREAYAKSQYMKRMTRIQKERLINKGIWPIGGVLRDYYDKKFLEKS